MDDMDKLMNELLGVIEEKGGPGSGFFDHAGRPGLVGGSAPEGSGGGSASGGGSNDNLPLGSDSPRNVRNFFIVGDIDGRQEQIGGGPKSKDGGTSIRITQRNKGSVEEACTIKQFVDGDKLVTSIRHKGAEVWRYETER